MPFNDWLIGDKNLYDCKKGDEETLATIATLAPDGVMHPNKNETSLATIATLAEGVDTKGKETLATLANRYKKLIYNYTVYNYSYSCSNLLNFDSTYPAKVAKTAKVHEESVIVEKPTPAYITQRMLELGLTKKDVRGETNPSLALDQDELNDIRSDKRLFDIWVEHVYRHKQLKALEITHQKQPEEYDLGETLVALPFDHKFKFTEHVLTALKKFLSGKSYGKEKPNELFIEVWFLANKNLTLEQILNGSAKMIALANQAEEHGESAEVNRLMKIAENAEYFRMFCIDS